MGKVNITIDGVNIQVEDNMTVLEAARLAGSLRAPGSKFFEWEG